MTTTEIKSTESTKEFHYIVARELVHKYTKSFYLYLLRVPSEDVVYFKLYDGSLNLEESGFLNGADTPISVIFCTSTVSITYREIMRTQELSEAGFEFLMFIQPK